ncbi:hypothetical protein D3C84_766730 [compost metagenome]
MDDYTVDLLDNAIVIGIAIDDALQHAVVVAIKDPVPGLQALRLSTSVGVMQVQLHDVGRAIGVKILGENLHVPIPVFSVVEPVHLEIRICENFQQPLVYRVFLPVLIYVAFLVVDSTVGVEINGERLVDQDTFHARTKRLIKFE